jgi:hypothetical protein
MILDVSSVPYNLNKQTVVVRVLGFLWRLLRLLCYLLLLLLQFFKLVLLLLPGLPSVDTLVHFLVVENHTNARSHLPHIVSTFISIPPATAAKAHLHYSSFSSLPKLRYNFSDDEEKEEEEEPDSEYTASKKLQIPKIGFNNNLQTSKPQSPHPLLQVTQRVDGFAVLLLPDGSRNPTSRESMEWRLRAS